MNTTRRELLKAGAGVVAATSAVSGSAEEIFPFSAASDGQTAPPASEWEK